MTPPTPQRGVTPASTAPLSAYPGTRYSYHGYPMPDWQARALPDHLVVHDRGAGADDNLDGLLAGLVHRHRTEQVVPVPTSRKAS